jgi:hypothetical protein
VNFTGLPVGTKIENGIIEVCPECGQNGLREVSGNKELFTHAQGADIDLETGS